MSFHAIYQCFKWSRESWYFMKHKEQESIVSMNQESAQRDYQDVEWA